MRRHWMLLASFALVPTVLFAQQDTAPQEKNQQDQKEEQVKKDETVKTEDGKLISVPGGKALGMSILGNQEAPKALVIVPWKRSELGSAPGVSPMLDDSKVPVDKEVFMRMLSFYEIRSETARPGAAAAKTNSAQPAAATQRRKQ